MDNFPGGDSPFKAADQYKPIGLMHISDEEFQTIRKLVYERFGINLTDQKKSLVVGRLQKLLRTLGCATFQDYLDYLRGDSEGRAMAELVNRISTNHTYFFREKEHFDFFVKTALPEIEARHKQKKSNDLRIWCAGCSTGEEAYVLVMLMLEYFGPGYGAWDAGLLATDVSADALTVAKAGVYSEDRMTQVPTNFRNRFFEKTPGGDWVVKDRVKSEITFRRFNLMNKVFPFRSRFDVIFCRNVMIYFDQPTREALVRRFFDQTAPGGYLFIGHSESLRRDSCPYDYVMPAVYKKREA